MHECCKIQDQRIGLSARKQAGVYPEAEDREPVTEGNAG